MKVLLKYFKPYRAKLIAVAGLYIISTMCTLLMPYLMSDIVNEGIYAQNMSMIIRCGIYMLLLSLLALGCGLALSRVNTRVTTGFSIDLMDEMFNKINSLSFEDFSSVGSSSMLTRATYDVFAIQDVAGMIVYAIVAVPMMFFGGAVLAFMSDWILAVVLLSMAPIVLFIVWLVTRRMGSLWEQSDKYIDMQNKVVRERLTGLRVIRAFDKEQSEHGRIEFATHAMAKNIIKANVLSGVISPLTIFLLNIATVVMLFIGAQRIQTEPTLMAGDIIATIQYVSLIANGLLVLSWTFAFLPRLKVCVKRISEVLLMQGTADEVAEDVALNGDISLRDVSFYYGQAESPALSNINMDIKSGQIISIIGGTGSGKSTLIKLLMRFYAPSEGNISLGGRDYASMSHATVRNNISVALQKGMIFNATIAENIKMGNPIATNEQVLNACRIAQMEDYIASHEEGLDFELAQAGANLSGGQKQRFNIARAIVKNASVYVFDDSFSALDYLTESKLRRELNRELENKTQIIVTQRAATAMRCDKIYVMERGAIVGAGTHAELMDNCPIYKEIYDSQLGGRDENE